MSAGSTSGALPQDPSISVLMGHFVTQATFYRIQKTFLSLGPRGPPVLLHVMVKPTIAWPQGWEVSGRDCACGSEEAGLTDFHSGLLCTSGVWCIH